jgi:hypothetical protein
MYGDALAALSDPTHRDAPTWSRVCAARHHRALASSRATLSSRCTTVRGGGIAPLAFRVQSTRMIN